MSNGSNDILIGLEEKQVSDSQARRLQELGLDLDLLGIGDEQNPISNSNPNKNPKNTNSSSTKPIEDLKELNNIFMQNQFGHISQQNQKYVRKIFDDF